VQKGNNAVQNTSGLMPAAVDNMAGQVLQRIGSEALYWLNA
jgi:hypothetical protein